MARSRLIVVFLVIAAFLLEEFDFRSLVDGTAAILVVGSFPRAAGSMRLPAIDHVRNDFWRLFDAIVPQSPQQQRWPDS